MTHGVKVTILDLDRYQWGRSFPGEFSSQRSTPRWRIYRSDVSEVPHSVHFGIGKTRSACLLSVWNHWSVQSVAFNIHLYLLLFAYHVRKRSSTSENEKITNSNLRWEMLKSAGVYAKERSQTEENAKDSRWITLLVNKWRKMLSFGLRTLCWLYDYS